MTKIKGVFFSYFVVVITFLHYHESIGGIGGGRGHIVHSFLR